MITAGPTKSRRGSHPVAAKDEEREMNGSGTESRSDMTVGWCNSETQPPINGSISNSSERPTGLPAHDILFDLESFVRLRASFLDRRLLRPLISVAVRLVDYKHFKKTRPTDPATPHIVEYIAVGLRN